MQGTQSSLNEYRQHVLMTLQFCETYTYFNVYDLFTDMQNPEYIVYV